MEEKESLPRWVARIDAIFAKGDDVDALREAMGNHGKVKQAGRCVVLVTQTRRVARSTCVTVVML